MLYRSYVAIDRTGKPMNSKSMMQHTKMQGFIARIAIACALLVTHAVAADPTPPAIDDISSYTRCAGEYQSFVLPGSCDVAYGANGLYVFKTGQSGTVFFSNGTFGDPIPGVAKSGYYRTTVVYPPSDPTGTGTGLTGDYYDNIFVKGYSKRRIDPMINFPWGGADPMPGIAAGAYSVRWTGKIQTRYDDTYTLITTSDDGVRVWVDGQPIINDWTTHGNKENTGTFVSLAGQKHDIRIEYFEGGGGAFMRLEWQSVHQARAMVPASCLFSQGADTPVVLPTYVPGTGTGLTGDYRNYSDLNGSHILRLDPIINFRWGDGSPDSSIATDNFTVRWTGQIQTRFDGDCTLSTISDDGVLLYLDGKLLINDWTTHGDKENTCTFASKAGQKHDIRIEYFESGGGANMYMKWQSANEGYTLVPTSCLYPYDMANAIPAASTVSPAFIEGFYGFTVPVVNIGILNDLGESQFYANVPLSATEATPVTLTEGSTTVSGSIVWTPTAVTEGPTVVIRKGDSLLFTFPTAGSVTITNYSGTFLPPMAVTSGQLLPVLFSKAGEFKVLARDDNGNEVGSRMVTVVSIDLPQSILGEVQFTRALNLTVSPSNAPVTFMGNKQLTVTTTALADGLAKLALTPLSRGTPRLLARINGTSGPLVCEKEISEFTIDTAALKSAVINAQTGIGTASLVMRPFIPSEEFTFTMFAHASTFKGGATNITVSTTGGASSNGEPPFVQKFDSITKEIIGIFRFDIEVPQSESKYCFHVERKQSEPAVVSGAMLHGSSSPFGLQASMPFAGLSLMIGLSPGGGTNGPTTNVNGDACHVLAYASLIFTQADDYSEDEKNASSNPETWKSRQWDLITSDYCVKGTKGDGNCNAVSYSLTVSDAPPFSGQLDNQIAALFGASSRQSSCKTCSGTCGPVSATMDSGTIPGKYTTSIGVCGTGSGDSLGSSVGGVFYVSKLDAHGLGSTTSQFPEKATVLGGRKGRVTDPIIQMNSGGDGSINGCSLYGWSGEPYCPPKNKWSFTAVVKDPITGENIPNGYEIRWRLSNFNYDGEGSSSSIPGMQVTATKNGQPLSIEATFPVGRWFPRLEVWRTHRPASDGSDGLVPLDEPELFSIAEIHSLVVEAYPSSNVALKNADSTIPDKVRYGTRFQATNNAGGQTVDGRVAISGGARGRVSLDGYAQNEYWVTGSDSADLPQVASLPDGIAQTYYLQGYRTSSTASRSLDLVISGQALIEACSDCSPFLLTPVTVTWQETDREKFASAFDVDIYPSEKKNIYADDHRIHIVAYLFANNYADDGDHLISSGDAATAEFEIATGSGSLSASEATTDDGLALVILETSTTPGDTYVVRGKEKYAPESISPWRNTANLVVIPGLPATITVQKSKEQYVSDGNDTVELTATVKDQFGNKVADGSEISWISHDSTTNFESTEAVTADGVATAVLKAPVLPKSQIIEVIAGNVVENVTMKVNRVGGTLTSNKSVLDLVGDTAVLTLQSDASDGTPVKWFSSNGPISGQGVLSGGSATATLSTSGGLLGRTIVHAVVGDRMAIWKGTFDSSSGLAIGFEHPTLVGGVNDDGIVNVTWADGTVHPVQYFGKTKVFIKGPVGGLAHVTTDGATITEAFVFESASGGVVTGEIGGRTMSLNGAVIDSSKHYTGQASLRLGASSQALLQNETGLNLSNNFTLSVWVNPDATGPAGLIARPGSWSVTSNSSGFPVLQVTTALGAQQLTSTRPLAPNSWNKITLTVAGSTASLHVANSSQTMALVAPLQNGLGLQLGGAFIGNFDDLTIQTVTGSPNAIVEGVDAAGRIRLDGNGRGEILVRSTGHAVAFGDKVFANIHVRVNPEDDEPLVIVETSYWYYPVDFLAGVVGLDTETAWGMVGGVGGGFIIIGDVGALAKNAWRSTGWSDKEPNGIEALLSGLGLLSTLGGPADGFVSAARVIVARIGDSPLGRVFYRRCKALFDAGAVLKPGEEALVEAIKASDAMPQVYKAVIDSDELWEAAVKVGNKLGQEAFNTNLQKIATTLGKQTAANVTKVLSQLDDAVLEALKASGKLDDALEGMAKVLKTGGKVEDMVTVLKNEHIYSAAYKQADLLVDFKQVGGVPGIDRTLAALKQDQLQVQGIRYEVETAAFFSRQGKDVQFISKIIDEIGADGTRKTVTDIDVLADGILYQCKKSTSALQYGKRGLEGAEYWTTAALKEVGGDASKVKYMVPPGTRIPPQIQKYLDRVNVRILDTIPHK